MSLLLKAVLALLALGIVVEFFKVAAQIWYVFLIAALSVPLWFLIRHIRMKRYFASPEFLSHKQEIQDVVAEHNEISNYVDEIRATGKFSLGKSSTGSQAHLASFTNTSKFGYKRDRNVVDFTSASVHNATLQVVRNASVEPIKYLMKYFDIPPTEEKLEEVENLGESISRIENAIENLKEREAEIASAISPPKFIIKHYLKEFQAQVGLSIPPLSIPYPVYTFKYISAGGNSSQEAKVTLDSPTIDALLEQMSERIKFRKSAAGQRALMTVSLRNSIKTRDDFTCRICSISVYKEPHLLLEVDHIKPVSKGGLSIEENLQTLCWKCNRTKSNKESGS